MKESVLRGLYQYITDGKRDLFDRIAANRTRHVTVVMENVAKTHNASAVIRTCDCFGIQDLHLIQREQQYEAIRDISKGAGQWINTFDYSSEDTPARSHLESIKSKGYSIVCTTPHADMTVEDFPLEQPIALVFGTEQSGLTDNTMNAADHLVKLPMYGFTESYNVSVSVALALAAIRKRLETETFDWKLSKEEQVEIRINWCEKIINNGEMVRKEIQRRILEKE